MLPKIVIVPPRNARERCINTIFAHTIETTTKLLQNLVDGRSGRLADSK
jgi:hypothetical protein